MSRRVFSDIAGEDDFGNDKLDMHEGKSGSCIGYGYGQFGSNVSRLECVCDVDHQFGLKGSD